MIELYGVNPDIASVALAKKVAREWSGKNKAIVEARTITAAKVAESALSFGLNEYNLVFKIEPSIDTDFTKWAMDNSSDEMTSLTPFDHFGLSDDVKACRSKTLNKCSTDPACTKNWSNTTLFVGSWTEFLDNSQDKTPEELKVSLGLNYNIEDAYITVLYIHDRNNVRVPCSKIPSVDCENKCDYDNLPLNFCENNAEPKTQVADNIVTEYPALAEVVKNMWTCDDAGMPFTGVGTTSGGYKEFILHAGTDTKCKVKLVLPLVDVLDKIHANKITDPNDFSKFKQSPPSSPVLRPAAAPVLAGDEVRRGGGKTKKRKKTKKKKTKRKKRSKKKKRRKRKTKKRK